MMPSWLVSTLGHEHCTGNSEVKGLNPGKAELFQSFFSQIQKLRPSDCNAIVFH